MNPSEREQLRLSLLRFLGANNTRFGLGSSLLEQMARSEGRPSLTKAEVEEELEYLVDKGFSGEFQKPLSPENRAWKITAEGRDFLAQYQA